MKRIVMLFVAVLLLAGCGLDSGPQEGLTNALGSGSQSVVMSGGSTMIRNYYEGTVATGGLFTAVSDIASCWAVFEPNGENVRISLQLQPQGDAFHMGEGGVPYFVGGGSITWLTIGPEMPKEGFRASCEGTVGLTAVPILVNGQVMWLSSVDLSKTVWKAPAGTELSAFFSENGYRVMLLMTTDIKVDVPDTAVAEAYDLNPNELSAYDLNPNDLSIYNLFKAYDLNPNDLSITDSQCGGMMLMNTSDADIGPIFRGIMFETLIGTSGMLVLGDGNTLGNTQAQGAEAYPFVCDDSSKAQLRSADLELGEASYRLVELRYPEITLQTADGRKETLTDITVLGIIPAHKPVQ